jgi:hypothetical protein
MDVNEWMSYECSDEGAYTQNIHNSSTRSHPSEEENCTRNHSKYCKPPFSTFEILVRRLVAAIFGATSLVIHGQIYSRFHETLITNVPNFVAKFASSLRSSEVHIGIHKPICKQSPWLVPEVKEANQMRCLQIGLWISLGTFELRNELANFATKFGTFVVKVSWNRL